MDAELLVDMTVMTQLSKSLIGPLQILQIVIYGDMPVEVGLAVVIFIADDRHITAYDGTLIAVHKGDILVLPMGGLHSISPGPLACIALLAPQQFLGAAITSRSTAMILPRSGSVDALRHHVERLHSIKVGALDAAQASAASRSIRELWAAAMVTAAPIKHRSAQRQDALLQRIVEYIDATLTADVSIASLCNALACSRSALYRAAMPRGGLIKIIMHQRLIAVHGALRRHDDQRPIAEIARDHGFLNASQFSRSFRRAFGVSAGQVRSAWTHNPANGMLCHSDSDSFFTLVSDNN